MMNKTARTSRLTLAFAGITAGFVALFGFTAEAASPHDHTSDGKPGGTKLTCKRIVCA